MTLGMLRSILVVPFKVVIPKEEAIPSYHRILLKENEGVFLLLVTALKDYLTKGKGLQILITGLVQLNLLQIMYYLNNDIIYEFLKRYCIISYDEKDKVTVAELYDNKFLEFARLKGIPKEQMPYKRSFSEALEEKGIHSVKINKATYKVGIRLRIVADIADLIDDDLKDEPSTNTNDNNNDDNKTSSPSNPSNPSSSVPTNPASSNNSSSSTPSQSSPSNPSRPTDQPNSSLKFKVIEFDELLRPFRYAKFVSNGNTVVMVRSYDDLKTLECLHCNNYFTDSMELFRHIQYTFKVKITDMDIIQCNEDGSTVKEGIWIPEFKFSTSISSGSEFEFNSGSNGSADDQ